MSIPDANIRPPVNPIQPGAYSTIDASALQQAGPFPSVVAVLGAAMGGAPNDPILFRDPHALKARLRGGAGFDCARFAFAGGAAPVVFARVGHGIAQGTIDLKDGSNAAVVTLTSLDYGAWTDNIKVTVEANNKVTITYIDDLGISFKEVYAVGASATKQDIADAINGNTPGFPQSNYVSAATGSGTAPLATASATALTGGSDGSVASGDWTTALTAIETLDVDIVLVATGDATVHASVLQHCLNMSQPTARKERVTRVGGTLGETVAQQITRIGNARDARLELIYTGPGGLIDFDDSGNLQAWDDFYAAAKFAGLEVSQPDVATALTHKRFPAVDVGTALSTIQGGDVDQLLREGVAPITPAPGSGLWIVDAITGYNASDDFRDAHKIRNADLVAKTVREELERQFVGNKSLTGTDSDITNVASRELSDLQSKELLTAYQQAIVTRTSPRSYNVTLPVMLVDATKFIFITVALQPASTINVSAPVPDDALL